MAARSIDTLYRGNLFRSRLEARWAVFMDKAVIGWEYEPEWMEINLGPVRYNWLPDFRLSDGRWVEVKGALSPAEHERLLLMADAVGGHEGDDVVVLGHLPPEGGQLWPVQLHRCSSDLWAVPWVLTPLPLCPLESSRPRVLGTDITAELLLEGIAAGQPRSAAEPLAAARSARFQ